MRTLLSRYALSVSAAAMLAGCGGSQPPIGAPGAVPQASTNATHAELTTLTRPTITYGLLYSFKPGSGDGVDPYASLVNVNGILYGTTVGGGAYGGGTVFAIAPSGTEAVVHSFGASGDGETPFAGLTEAKGTLYGTTGFGGAHNNGTVFSITPSCKETVLHSFNYGSGDGEQPDAALLNVKGTFYGTTQHGGRHADGTVFSISTSGTETVLHSFGGSVDGVEPYAGLIDVKGTLYGTTYRGGADSNGTVFKISPSGNESVLHSFGAPPDGANPYAGLLDVDGRLYGTTQQGGGANGEGTVFSITTSGTETALHSFGPYFSGDGEQPYGNLVNVKGTLYGTTYGGGANNVGTVFKIKLLGKETVLHSFGASGDGKEPYAGLIKVKGMLYGTTENGGANGDGTVYSLTP
jgi:uncharacterized repeat protein (TIGR03803 family)